MSMSVYIYVWICIYIDRYIDRYIYVRVCVCAVCVRVNI